MLPESNLYSFLDEKNKFITHFFEGQKLIHDLAIITNLKGKGFTYFRDIILTLQPMIAFLKYQEEFGLYINSKDPYFILKIETNYSGLTRSLLLPNNFDQIPSNIKGVLRLIKNSMKKKQTTLIDLNSINLNAIASKISKEAYQAEAQLFLSEKSDQSVLLIKLPQSRKSLDLNNYWENIKTPIEQIFEKALTSKNELKKNFQNIGLTYLGNKEVKFKCSCSKERMINTLLSLIKSGTPLDDLFDKDKEFLETHCDYCNTNYLLPKKEFI